MPRLPRLLTAVALTAAAVAGLSGCAAPGAGAADARVVVRIAPTATPVDYEVHVAQAHGDFRAVQRMRTGQTRTFDVPAGWVTVRIPGLCVVPAQNSGTAVVEVDRHACRLA